MASQGRGAQHAQLDDHRILPLGRHAVPRLDRRHGDQIGARDWGLGTGKSPATASRGRSGSSAALQGPPAPPAASSMARSARSTPSAVTSRCVTAQDQAGPRRQHQHPAIFQAGDELAPPSLMRDRRGNRACSCRGFGSSRRPLMRASARGQLPGVGVVLGQPGDVMLQGVQRGGGQHPRLPHAAAQHLAVPHRLGNQRPRPGQGRPDRRTQPLAETDAHRVEPLGPAGRIDARGHHGIEQPGAVEMGPQSLARRPSGRSPRRPRRAGCGRRPGCGCSPAQTSRVRG